MTAYIGVCKDDKELISIIENTLGVLSETTPANILESQITDGETK